MKNAFIYTFIGCALSVGISSCKLMYDPDARDPIKQPVMETTADGDSVIVKAGQIYAAGKFKRFWLGDHYRDLWTTPVKVPVFNFDTIQGGFEILEKGGGMQTYSLKLERDDGQLYSLRSVQKDPTSVLPLPLQYSFADELIQDQISASHPFGAYILPKLGDAAGIFHTTPRLYYLPDTPTLGKYRKEFGGALVMFEEDADESWTENENFGYTENAVSTNTLLEDMLEDNDNHADQESFLRVRLFDMWINDWDRHAGQFRWAEFEEEDQVYYRPIPEDRDNMFFRFDGVIPWIASRKWAMRKFQDFTPEVEDIIGLNFNGRYTDRRFLTELGKDEWLKMARDLQDRLTDDIIEEAVKGFPKPIYEKNGQEVVDLLKARRNNLEHIARAYYSVLAKEVDIVGSNESEFFEVIRQPDSSIQVRVFESNDDGDRDREIYFREFYVDETKEIRLFGMGDTDHFEISGASEESILVRVIGGEGEDYLESTSSVDGWSSKTHFYDTEDGNKISENSLENRETKIFLSDSRHIMRYDMESFEYDKLLPQVVFGFNTDDKFFIGGGATLITYGFNRIPYATYQRLVANVSPFRNAWAFEYEGDFTNIIGSLGVHVNSLLRAPNYFSNFYGFGNDTEIVEDESFYEVKYNEFRAYVGLTAHSENFFIKFGPQYQQLNAKREVETFIAGYENHLPSDAFASNRYLGFRVETDIHTVEDKRNPERGVWWLADVEHNAQTNNSKAKFSKVSSELRGYYSIEIPFDLTLAARIGVGTIAGDFNFYQANAIGGNQGFNSQGNVRGLSRDRYSGRSMLYHNVELRIPVLRLPFYYMPFELGIYTFVDNGRIWSDLPDSTIWHTSYGGGLFLRPAGLLVTTLGVAHSEEQTLLQVNLGFLF